MAVMAAECLLVLLCVRQGALRLTGCRYPAADAHSIECNQRRQTVQGLHVHNCSSQATMLTHANLGAQACCIEAYSPVT